jgi:hypothetical protein
VTTNGRPDPTRASPIARIARTSAWHAPTWSVDVAEMLVKARWTTPSAAAAGVRRRVRPPAPGPDPAYPGRAGARLGGGHLPVPRRRAARGLVHPRRELEQADHRQPPHGLHQVRPARPPGAVAVGMGVERQRLRGRLHPRLPHPARRRIPRPRLRPAEPRPQRRGQRRRRPGRHLRGARRRRLDPVRPHPPRHPSHDDRPVQPLPRLQLHVLRDDPPSRGVRRRALPRRIAADHRPRHPGAPPRPAGPRRSHRRPRTAHRDAHEHRLRAPRTTRMGPQRPRPHLPLPGAQRHPDLSGRRPGHVRQHPGPREAPPVDRGHHRPLGRLPGIPAPPMLDWFGRYMR